MRIGSRFAGVTVSVALALPLILTADATRADDPAALIRYSLSPCPDRVLGAAGETFEMARDVVIGLDARPAGDFGLTAWSVSVAADGAQIVDITTAGTIAAPSDADPPGLRDPRSFEYTELGDADRGLGECAGRSSAVTVVVLSFISNVTLPPGESTVARLVVRGAFPDADAGVETVSLRFVDGCRGSRTAVDNFVTWSGLSCRPALEECDLDLAGAPTFVRGDSNDDGQVRLADAVTVLTCRFLDRGCPTCFDAADANDDGRIGLSDAVTILNFLYMGGPPPPAPGPYGCGLDPTADLRDPPEPCRQTSCSPAG